MGINNDSEIGRIWNEETKLGLVTTIGYAIHELFKEIFIVYWYGH